MSDQQRHAEPIVWVAGVGWDDMPGTDKRMALVLAETRPILWVDSPRAGAWAGWWGRRRPAVEGVHPGITRFRTPAPPGFSRWPMRHLTALLWNYTVRRSLNGLKPYAVVCANPVGRFPRAVSGPRILYMTDDWIAGAALMGFRTSFVSASLKANLAAADAVAGVSPDLLNLMQRMGLASHVPRMVLPNGAPRVARHPDRRRLPIAGVIGQLNERLDLDALEAVVAAGVRLRMIGPRADSSPAFARRLDALLACPGVEWTGPLGADELNLQLAELSVGLTPYSNTKFNRASSPLKTLEYLAAGLPVVSTALSASRWINSRHVVIADSSGDFATAVTRAVSHEAELGGEDERIALAERHEWPRRAQSLLGLIERARHVDSRSNPALPA